MDSGASWATVHGVVKGQTWLKWLSTQARSQPVTWLNKIMYMHSKEISITTKNHAPGKYWVIQTCILPCCALGSVQRWLCQFSSPLREPHLHEMWSPFLHPIKSGPGLWLLWPVECGESYGLALNPGIEKVCCCFYILELWATCTKSKLPCWQEMPHGEALKKVEVLVAQSCPTLCDLDCSLSSPSVHRNLQARILEWVAISFSSGSSLPRDWTWVSHTAGRFFTFWATRED